MNLSRPQSRSVGIAHSTSPIGQNGNEFWWRVIGIGWLLGFSCWFHSFLLPNNPIPRWMIWEMMPFDLMDIIDPPVASGGAPWSWFFLLQRVPFLAVAILIWIGAWGAGSVSLRWMKADLVGAERVFFACCLGLSIVSLSTLLMGVCSALFRGAMLFVLLLGPLLEFISRFRTTQASRGSQGWMHSWSCFAAHGHFPASHN